MLTSNHSTTRPTVCSDAYAHDVQVEAHNSENRDKRKTKASAGGHDDDGDRRRSRKNEERDEEVRERKRRKEADALPSMPFEGLWIDGQYEIRYVAQKAGDHQLNIWADTNGTGDRDLLPGSPFAMHVVENDPAPASSNIGYPQEEKKSLYAGEKLVVRPQLRDQYGNAAAASPLSSITALLEAPDGPHGVAVKPSNKVCTRDSPPPPPG